MASWVAERISIFLLALIFSGAVLTEHLAAQRLGEVPEELSGVGVDEKLDATIDLNLEFRDESGRLLKLAELFDGKPLVLTLNYANCPMLCGLQLNGLIRSLQACDFRPGREFRLVTVSIDPLETSARAEEKKRTYIERLGDPEAAPGWSFLVGEEANIRKLADQVGFRYQFVEETGEYVHAAVSMVLTPDGHVSRYLYGVNIPERSLRFSLLEAGQGKIGTTMDQILLFCFHYDAQSGAYAPAARKLMSIGGGVVLFLVGSMIFYFWRRERRSKAEVTPVPLS